MSRAENVNNRFHRVLTQAYRLLTIKTASCSGIICIFHPLVVMENARQFRGK